MIPVARPRSVPTPIAATSAARTRASVRAWATRVSLGAGRHDGGGLLSRRSDAAEPLGGPRTGRRRRRGPVLGSRGRGSAPPVSGLDFERARSRSVWRMAVSMTISEAAEASGLTAHTLRYYERAGLLDPVGREAGGRRRYGDRDLSRIAFLTKLRATGMPIREVREYAELLREGDGNERERLALLEAHRDQVRARAGRDGEQPGAHRLQDRLVQGEDLDEHAQVGVLGGDRARARLHGDERVLHGRARRRRVDRDDPPRAGAGRHAAGHGRHVRAVRQRGAGRARDRRAGATRSSWRRSSGSCWTRTTPPSAASTGGRTT